jgi:delta14-sterol reductase
MTELIRPITPSGLAYGFSAMAIFMLLMFLGAKFLPGKVAHGMPLADGSRRAYKLNGMLLFVSTQVVLLVAALGFGLSLTPLLENFWSLFIAFNTLSVALTLFLFVRGRQARARALQPQKSVLADLWFGPELNPEFAGVDLKYFCYQPSLIGLGVLVQAFSFRQWEVYGVVSTEMILYIAFWWAYLFTHYLKESFMLSTWDIIAENFGFMLVWGDLTFVPFFYCIAGWFLVDPSTPLPGYGIALALGLYGFGHWMFRGANWQKDAYKTNPKANIWGRPPEALHGRLLVSGWWGIGRKLNYTGEIMVYVAITSLAGFESWVPWTLPLWLTTLLIHRAWRDEQRCRAKYGAKWDDYCARAKFRMFPFVY